MAEAANVTTAVGLDILPVNAEVEAGRAVVVMEDTAEAAVESNSLFSMMSFYLKKSLLSIVHVCTFAQAGVTSQASANFFPIRWQLAFVPRFCSCFLAVVAKICSRGLFFSVCACSKMKRTVIAIRSCYTSI